MLEHTFNGYPILCSPTVDPKSLPIGSISVPPPRGEANHSPSQFLGTRAIEFLIFFFFFFHFSLSFNIDNTIIYPIITIPDILKSTLVISTAPSEQFLKSATSDLQSPREKSPQNTSHLNIRTEEATDHLCLGRSRDAKDVRRDVKNATRRGQSAVDVRRRVRSVGMRCSCNGEDGRFRDRGSGLVWGMGCRSLVCTPLPRWYRELSANAW